MGLKVWLPLNGDLRNLGCSNIGISPIEATPTYVNGKIGQCYQRAHSSTQSTNGIKLETNFLDIFGTQASIAVWIKPLGTHTHYNGTILSSGDWNKKRWSFGVSQNNSQVDVLCGGHNNYLTCAVPANEWTHLVSTFDNGVCKVYKNGVYVGEKTGQSAFDSDATWTGVGRESYANGYFGFNGLINDLRIYNHVLSAAEAHELAQGLVLHYKLSNPYMESSIFLDSTVDNTTAYNASIGKYGYNSTSNLAKTIGIFKGKNSVKISTITAGQTAQPYTYFSNLFTSNGTNAPAYKALSFDYYTTCPTTTWLNIYKLGSGTGTATWKTTNTTWIKSGTYNNSSNSILVNPNEWNHIEIIFNGTSDANAEWGYCINGPAHTSSADYYFLYANIQLEQNDHVTGQKASLHDNIIVDSSGYNHNGSITGNIISNSSAARYNYNLKFNDSASSIGIGNLSTMLPNGEFTFNIWFKKITDEWSSKAYETILGGPSGFELEAKVSSTNSPVIKCYNWGGGTIAYTLDEWHMLTMVRNSSETKFYLDGELKVTGTAGSIPSGNYFIGAWKTATQQNYRGHLSDARIYVTPLLDNDIKVLYNTTMRIDPHKNIHNFELNENAPYNKLTPTGMLEDNMVESYLTLSDGSKWKLMLFHYVDGGNNLFTSSNATYCNDWGLYSRLSEITNYQYDGKYEYYVIQDGTEFRWTQTSSPTAGSISGLTTVSGYNNPVNGLAKASQNNTYIGYNAWWGACGCWTSYSTGGKTGIPGFGSHDGNGICTKYLILYTRVSDFGGTFENGTAFSNNFIEM